MIFSDGGYRRSIPCSVGAFIISAVFDDCTRPVAAQGIVLKGYSGSFPAEAVALETATRQLISWLVPTARELPCGLGCCWSNTSLPHVTLCDVELRVGDSIGDLQLDLVVACLVVVCDPIISDCVVPARRFALKQNEQTLGPSSVVGLKGEERETDEKRRHKEGEQTKSGTTSPTEMTGKGRSWKKV